MKLMSTMLFAAGGVLLIVQSLVPWTSRGTLSGAAPVDLVGLVLDGTVTRLGALEVAALLAVPVLGAVLLALAAGSRLRLLRSGMAGLGIVLGCILLVRLADLHLLFDGARLGVGAALTLLGVALLGIACLLDLAGSRRKELS